MKKIIFFDIDGTLISEKTNKIPESTCRAIKQAKEKGHLLFINTGRTFCRIVPELRELPFDGYLCGCGIHITYHDEVLQKNTITQDTRDILIETVLKCNMDAVFESSEKVYCFDRKSRFEEMEEIKIMLEEEGTGVTYFTEQERCTFDKMYLTSDVESDVEQFLSVASKGMDVIERGLGAYECVPKGFSKATAMEYLYEKFGIEKENSYVFGDSSNDLPMFQSAAHAIAMEAHSEVLDPYTEFVTKSVEEGGIEFAMKQYGLI